MSSKTRKSSCPFASKKKTKGKVGRGGGGEGGGGGVKGFKSIPPELGKCVSWLATTVPSRAGHKLLAIRRRRHLTFSKHYFLDAFVVRSR